MLLATGLSFLKAGGDIRGYEETLGAAAKPMMASNVDEGDCEGEQLLGSGSVLKETEVKQASGQFGLL